MGPTPRGIGTSGPLITVDTAAAAVAGATALHLEAKPNISPIDLDKELIASAAKDHVQDPGKDSPNRLLYVGDQ